MQRTPALPIPRVDIRAISDQRLRHFLPPLLQGPMQRSTAILVLETNIRAMDDQQTGCCPLMRAVHIVQGRMPALVLCVCIGAVF